ncbi:MAG: FkbM family methyltransferase [Candidatus Methylacidiphilales bacterium]
MSALSGWIHRYIIKHPAFRERLTRLIFGTSDQTVELLGSSVLINQLKENGYLRAARLSESSSLLRDEVPVMLNLLLFAKPGGALIDAGANIGVYSILFSKLRHLYPDFTIHAFEVNPHTFERLHQNALTHSFSAYNVGLSAREESFDFVEGAVSHVTTRADNTGPYSIKQRSFSGRCVPLWSFSFPSDDLILKIDVEGHELDVLRGAEPLFKDRRVACVYVDGYEDPEVVTFLRSHGFQLRDGRTLLPAPEGCYALLAIRPDVSMPLE